ncbi:MAG: hypothetical protein ACTSV5_03435 [Promethearchaeota archaeon]
MNNVELFKISKYVYAESFLQSQLDMSGSSVSSVMEKMEKNKRYIKTQVIITKFVMILYVSFLIFLPFSAYTQIQDAINGGISITWVLFLGGVINGGYFLFQFAYLLMFGMFSSTGLFTGNIFDWLSTLPLKKKEMNKIGIMTLFRLIDAQFIALMLIFPIATAILTKSIIITLISLGISTLNTIFSFNVLIILSKKFAQVIKGAEANAKGSNLTRILFLVGFLGTTLLAALGVQFLMPIINPLYFQEPTNLALFETLNKWISLAPFPLSGGYLLTSFIIGFNEIGLLQVLPYIAGLVIFALIDYFMIKKSLKIMNDVIISKTDSKGQNFKVSTTSDVSITVVPPIKAYFERDKSMILRDIQAIMFIIVPMILPWIPFFITSGLETEFSEIQVFGVLGLIYCITGSIMMIFGLANIEKTGTTINASLPIIVKDQVKARLKWVYIIVPLGNLLPVVMYLGKPIFWNVLIVQGLIAFVSLLIGTFTLLLWIRLFGKLKKNYVLAVVQIRNKTLKNVLIFAIDLVLMTLVTIGFIFLLMSKDIIEFTLIIFPIELALAFSLYFVYNKMFSTSGCPEKLKISK